MTGPDLADIARYLGEARWFGGKGRPFRLVESRPLGSVSPTVSVDLVTVSYDDAAGGEECYQLPLVVHPSEQPQLARALIGRSGEAWVYDAVHDASAMGALLGGFETPADAGSSTTGDADAGSSTTGDADAGSSTTGGLAFHALPGAAVSGFGAPRVFAGEQSSSSVMFGDQAVLKFFRKVTPGENPDVSIHEALTVAGSPSVAALYGWYGSGDLVLGMLQAFLTGATDGWDLALERVRTGADLTDEAAALGRAVRDVHAALATAFPTRDRTPSDLATLSGSMIARLDAAVSIAPALAPHVPALRRTYDAVRDLPGDRITRIHGDLHLGQTLRTDSGWKIVDFEGEPAKTLAERLQPDSPWRDVAGMLRSFDYAPKADAMQNGSADLQAATAWSARHQEAFLAGYRAGSHETDAEQRLLAAYIADKAVYEVVYEARNRPTWISIPLAAIAELTSPEGEPS